MTESSSDIYDYYYENYLLLYNLYGRGRPRINRDDYEELDLELIKLVRTGEDNGLIQGQVSRVRDIEYMLMDDIAEGLMDRRS